jgi:hypothetical protein
MLTVLQYASPPLASNMTRRTMSPPRGSSALVYSKELNRNLDEVCALRNHYNHLKYQSSQLYHMVQDLQMKCQELNISHEDLNKEGGNSADQSAGNDVQEEALLISQLEEAVFHSDRKTKMLKHMLERTKSNKRALETKLELCKKKLASTQTEERRLASSTRELDNTVKNTKRELQQAQKELKQKREFYAAELTEINILLEERKKLNRERDAMNIRRSAIVAQAQGDLDEEGEARLKTEVSSIMNHSK